MCVNIGPKFSGSCAQRFQRSALNSTRRLLKLVTDFLEHNELEFALRSMQSAAEEQAVSFPPAAMRDLKRAAFLMRIDL